MPFYLYPSRAPGSKGTNAPAFTTPVPYTAQGDLGRNPSSLRWNDDTRKVQAKQLHGGDGDILASLGWNRMILDVQSHGNHSGPFGSGGPNGGPRSIQLALKLPVQPAARSFQNQ